VQREATAALPPAADTALSTLWRDALSSEASTVVSGQLRDVARQVGRDARAADLRPEELIVAIKDSWSAQNGELHGWNKRSSVEHVVSDVISLSIEEFYSAP
jgi:hypothetical protein